MIGTLPRDILMRLSRWLLVAMALALLQPAPGLPVRGDGPAVSARHVIVAAAPLELAMAKPPAVPKPDRIAGLAVALDALPLPPPEARPAPAQTAGHAPAHRPVGWQSRAPPGPLLDLSI